MGVNFSAINLKVGETGLADLERRLDAVDKKAEKIRDNLVGNFKSVRKPAAEAAEAIEEVGEHTELMSHSAMIGFGELTRGIAKTVTAGQAGAFSMKEFAGAAMRLGASLGGVGGLAGIAVLVGGALYEMFSKARTEMKATEEQFKTSIGNMANESRGQDLVKQARDVLYGTPYDDKGQLQNPSAVKGAFQGSLVDLRSRIAMLQDKTRGMIRKGAFQGGTDNESLDSLDRLLKAAEPLEKKLREINTALAVMRDTPAEKGLLGPTSTATKPLTAEEIERNARELQKLAAYVDGILTQGTLQALGAKITGGLGPGGAGPLLGGRENFLGGKGPTVAKIIPSPDQQEAQRIVGEWKRFAEHLGEELSKTLATSFSKGFEALFSKGGNLKDGFKAMTGALLEGLGGLFEQVGESALLGLSFMQKIKDAIMGFTPELGLAAAIGLIALGAAMKGAGGRIGSSGSGGSSYSSGGSYGAIVHQYTSPVAPPSSPSAGGITPKSATHNYFTVIGPNDPTAQRTIDELIRKSTARGSIR